MFSHIGVDFRWLKGIHQWKLSAVWVIQHEWRYRESELMAVLHLALSGSHFLDLFRWTWRGPPSAPMDEAPRFNGTVSVQPSVRLLALACTPWVESRPGKPRPFSSEPYTSKMSRREESHFLLMT